jgi:cobalt-zinc-cadmium efflux system outer membrane protein
MYPSKFKIRSSILNTAIAVSVIALLGVSASAQTQLDSLIALAVNNNPEIKMARYESSAAEARISPARTLPDPELKVGAMNVPTNFSLTSDMMTMVPQVSLMQMFPWFGKLSATGEAERYAYESSAQKLNSAILIVVANVKDVYGKIYSTEKSIQYLEYKRELLQGVVKVAEQLFSVGQVPQQDVFRATAELTMVQSEIITMQSLLSDLEAKLGALLGQNAPYNVQIDTLQLPVLDSLSVLEARLGAQNPDLKGVKNIELAAKAKKVFAMRDAIPDVSAGISYGYRGALMPNGSKALDMLSFEVGVSLPVFFGSRQRKMIDEADFMQRATAEQYRTTELGLFSRLRSVYADAEAQLKLIPLYSKELIPQYAATYNSSLSAYSVGKTTFAMLIDNLTTLINTKIELTKIESAYFSASAEIAKLVGEDIREYRGVK